MKFTIKLPLNAKEVNEANQHNANIKAGIERARSINEENAKKRTLELSLPRTKRKVYNDVDVPSEDLMVKVPEVIQKDYPLLCDINKIRLPYINKEGNIVFEHEGRTDAIVVEYSDEVWSQLENHFNK